MRVWYTGTANPEVPIARLGVPAWQRVLSRIDKTPEGCWLWQGPTSRGYGYINARGQALVHRVVYEHFKGVPDAPQLDHLCHTRDKSCRGGPTCRHRRCVNPDHLEPVTNLENAARGRAGDAIRRRAALITHCPQGHEYTPENTCYYGPNRHRYCRTCNQERGYRHWRATHTNVGDPRRTFTPEQLADIRARRDLGVSVVALAAEHGVGRTTIYNVLRKRRSYREA